MSSTQANVVEDRVAATEESPFTITNLLGGNDEQLRLRAERLYPDDQPHAAHNRAQWLSSVAFLRSNKRGSRWLLDRPVERRANLS